MHRGTSIILFCLLAVTGICGCGSRQHKDADSVPAHHADKGFVNPHLEPGKRGFFRYLKMRWFGEEDFPDYQATAHRVPTAEPDLQQIDHPGDASQVTWIGHATVLVQHRGVTVLTDPVFSTRASPVSFLGPERAHPPALDIPQLPPVDYAVISHNHYDHLDMDSVRKIGNSTLWLVPLGLKRKLLEAGIAEEQIRELDWWEQASFPGVEITATPAQHWSARTLWDRNETLWASWMVQIEGFTFWYSGDTGYNPYQFKEIGRRFPGIDLALISIGAYAPRWFMQDMHVNPAEAVQIHQDIGSSRSLGIQWGTFPLTAEPIDEPPEKLRLALEAADIPPSRFAAMRIGETLMVEQWKKE